MLNIKKFLAAAGMAVIGTVMISGSASAGQWYLDAGACPDLREDLRDARHDRGRADRREDRRDQRVLDCPRRSWSYRADRNDRRYANDYNSGIRAGTPGLVFVDYYGGFFRIDGYGDRQQIDVVISYPRYRNRSRRNNYWQVTHHAHDEYYQSHRRNRRDHHRSHRRDRRRENGGHRRDHGRRHSY